MPRKPRTEVAGGIHHVWARGVDKRLIFMDDRDRQRYLQLLGDTVADRHWLLLAFCLMPNHIHLLVETPEPNLGLGMHRVHGTHAREFNERYDRVGHLFQGRYGAKLVVTDAQLWVTAAYIALNPVEGHLAGRPDMYWWSSHGAEALGHAPEWLATDRLLEFFGAFGGDPATQYAAFVDGRS